MAEEKKPAEQESAKTTAKPAARKKTTAAKAPAKTVQTKNGTGSISNG